MSQTLCKRCGFLPPMRRPHASGDLAHPNRIHQCTDRVSMRSEHQPKCLLHSHKLAYVQIGSWRHPGIPPILDIGAGIKSP
jgi:hypothetical protein